MYGYGWVCCLGFDPSMMTISLFGRKKWPQELCTSSACNFVFLGSHWIFVLPFKTGHKVHKEFNSEMRRDRKRERERERPTHRDTQPSRMAPNTLFTQYLPFFNEKPFSSLYHILFPKLQLEPSKLHDRCLPNRSSSWKNVTSSCLLTQPKPSKTKLKNTCQLSLKICRVLGSALSKAQFFTSWPLNVRPPPPQKEESKQGFQLNQRPNLTEESYQSRNGIFGGTKNQTRFEAILFFMLFFLRRQYPQIP